MNVCETSVTNNAGVEFAIVSVTELAEGGIHSRPISVCASEWIAMLTIDEALATARILNAGALATDQTICQIGGWFRSCSRVEASGLGLALSNAAFVANRLLNSSKAAA